MYTHSMYIDDFKIISPLNYFGKVEYISLEFHMHKIQKEECIILSN